MNQNPGVIGRKLGMTQIFAEDGTVVPCTVVESNAIVVGKRTKEKDGYDAIIVGTGERKDKHTNKAVAGQFKKANVPGRRTLREMRCSSSWGACVPARWREAPSRSTASWRARRSRASSPSRSGFPSRMRRPA